MTPIKRVCASSWIRGRLSWEVWWWTRSEMSKTHRVWCSPSASTKTVCPLALKCCTEFQETLPYQRVSALFVIVRWFFTFKKNKFDPKQLIFMKKHKLFFSKAAKHSKTFCSYCYLWRVNVKKQGKKQRVLWMLSHNIYRIQKINFHQVIK